MASLKNITDWAGAAEKVADTVTGVIDAYSGVTDILSNPTVISNVLTGNNKSVALLSEAAQQSTSIWGSKSVSQSIVKVDTVTSINGLPPIPDNIVDPPAFYETTAFEKGRVTMKSWDTTINKSGPFIGRDYFDRVMARGSMLFLLPLELSTPLSKLAANAIVGDGSGESAYVLGAANYGYEVKFQTRRYTESVLMHFFMAAGAMGLDLTDSKIMARAKACLPPNIYKTITANTIGETEFETLLGNMKSDKGIAASLSKLSRLDVSGALSALFSSDDKSGNSDASVSQEANANKSEFDLLQERIVSLEKQRDEYQLYGSTEMTTSLETQIENLKAQQSKLSQATTTVAQNVPSNPVEEAISAINDLYASASTDELSTAISNVLGNTLINVETSEKQVLMHYVGGFNPNLMTQFGLEIKNALNFTVFNLNGAPSRNMSFSNETGDSNIAKLTNRVSVSKLLDTVKDTSDSASKYIQKLAGDGPIGSALSSALEGIDTKGIIDDIYLHNASTGKEYLIGLMGEYDRMLMPRVYNSSSFSPSYHCDIREVCISTDKYSLLRIFWTIAHLMPYAVPMQSNGMAVFGNSPSITPKAPMYAMAYVKGVMNLPRCIISNLSLEFDPKFQTIEGVPTEVNIGLDLTSFISLATTPVLGSLWTASYSTEGYSDKNWTVITQMFNPTSSINIIATMCGFNTVFTQPSGVGFLKMAQAMIFGKVVGGAKGGLRSVKNAYANIKKGYIGSVADDRLFGTDSNFKTGVYTKL
jgi:hypothetical protein